MSSQRSWDLFFASEDEGPDKDRWLGAFDLRSFLVGSDFLSMAVKAEYEAEALDLPSSSRIEASSVQCEVLKTGKL